MAQPDRKTIRHWFKLIRLMTQCQVCGGQPIEWHNPDHRLEPRRRIASMVSQATVGQIIDELLKCTPLCSKCHKKEHKRLEAIYNQTHPNTKIPSAFRQIL